MRTNCRMNALSRRVALAAGLALLAAAASAQVPDRLNYQGVLKRGDGTSVGEGYKDIEFRIWDATSGGNLVWARTQRAHTDASGLFNVVLMESGSPIAGAQTESLATVFTGSGGENRYLELTVVGSTAIMPRQRFVTAPYAFMAGNVKTAKDNFAVQGALTVVQGAQVKTLTVTENASVGGKLAVTENASVGGKLAIAGDPATMASWNSLLINNVANEDNAVVFRTRNDPAKDIQLINREGHFRFGFYGTGGGGDMVGINRNGFTWITAAQPETLALENTAGPDNYITLKVPGGHSNNVYLANRNGGFGVNLDGQPDIFGIDKSGLTWVRASLEVHGETRIMGSVANAWNAMPRAVNNEVHTAPCDGFLVVAAQNAYGNICINNQFAGSFNGTTAAQFGTFPLAKGDTWKIDNIGGSGGMYYNWRPLLRPYWVAD